MKKIEGHLGFLFVATFSTGTFNDHSSQVPILFILLTIVLSVLQFMNSDYPFGIFKLFLQVDLMYIIIENPALRKYM